MLRNTIRIAAFLSSLFLLNPPFSHAQKGKTDLVKPRIIVTTDKPEKLFFKDDGKIPNSKLPLILYKNAFDERGSRGASWLEKRFSDNK